MTEHEIELRGPLTKQQYSDLLKFLKENAKIVKEQSQLISYYQHPEHDLRLRMQDKKVELILKSGEMGDQIRKEIEVKLIEKDFTKIRLILSKIGFNRYVDWPRKRILFDYKGFEFALDDIEGFGPCWEIEKIASDDEIDAVKKEMQDAIDELGIKAISKKDLIKLIGAYNQKYVKEI